MKNKNYVIWLTVKVYLYINLRSSAIYPSAIEPTWPGCQVPAKKGLVTKLHGYKAQNGGLLSTLVSQQHGWQIKTDQRKVETSTTNSCTTGKKYIQWHHEAAHEHSIVTVWTKIYMPRTHEQTFAKIILRIVSL